MDTTYLMKVHWLFGNDILPLQDSGYLKEKGEGNEIRHSNVLVIYFFKKKGTNKNYFCHYLKY